MNILSKKALYKAFSWRMISIVISFSLSCMFFGTWQEAARYTTVYSIISTILYYCHELFYRWLRSKKLI